MCTGTHSSFSFFFSILTTIIYKLALLTALSHFTQKKKKIKSTFFFSNYHKNWSGLRVGLLDRVLQANKEFLLDLDLCFLLQPNSE
jgi:nicotinic acid phosphoribosyltransferase